MIGREPDDGKARELKFADSKSFWIAVIVVGVLAIPASRFQGSLKVVEWSFVLFGIFGSYVLPSVRDLPTLAVFSAICLAHIFVVWSMYVLVEMEGYWTIGLAIIGELIVFSIPGAWIIARFRSKNERAI